eukprot:Skav210452  [mRNA]  locus=scaffold1297:245809:250108:+ [translate_table: standard]
MAAKFAEQHCLRWLTGNIEAVFLSCQRQSSCLDLRTVFPMDSEHESSIPVEGISTLPTTNVVVDSAEYTDVPDKSPFARQTSMESGVEDAAFVTKINSEEFARQAKQLGSLAYKIRSSRCSDDETPKSKRSLLVESVEALDAPTSGPVVQWCC